MNQTDPISSNRSLSRPPLIAPRRVMTLRDLPQEVNPAAASVPATTMRVSANVRQSFEALVQTIEEGTRLANRDSSPLDDDDMLRLVRALNARCEVRNEYMAEHISELREIGKSMDRTSEEHLKQKAMWEKADEEARAARAHPVPPFSATHNILEVNTYLANQVMRLEQTVDDLKPKAASCEEAQKRAAQYEKNYNEIKAKMDALSNFQKRIIVIIVLFNKLFEHISESIVGSYNKLHACGKKIFAVKKFIACAAAVVFLSVLILK